MALSEDEKINRRRESQKRYRERNKEKIAERKKAYNAMYYQEHKEMLDKRHNEQRKGNVKRKEYMCEYMREYMREYRKRKAES